MNAYITKIAKFLPNDPVGNDEMEAVLGQVGDKPSKARRIILARNGIKQRYYAMDKNGNFTHTNVEMAANAIRGLCGDGFSIDDIDVLACGTSSPEQLIPSHAVMVHGALTESNDMEVVSFAGTCCAGIDSLKYAAMSVQLDPEVNAVAAASEWSSSWMRASYFQEESEHLIQLEQQPILSFQKEFLRWMLSDGAYAVLVQGQPNRSGVSLHIDWIEITSFANSTETCMYAGGDKNADGTFTGWAKYPAKEWLNQSLFALKQDTRVLQDNIVRLGIDFVQRLMVKRRFLLDDIDWFLPHLSSMFFKEQIVKGLAERGLAIPDEKWFINLPHVGNIGSASAFAMLEELLYSGRLKKGQKILMMIPESARFSYSYVMLTVV